MVQVTNVKLPERTRGRLEADSNQQRVQKPHDIRGSIPLVDYTNPAKFPPYLFREYPKMPLLDNNKPIVIDETGNVLIFYDAADEVEFKDMNPEIADEIERNTPAKSIADTVAAQADEIAELRAKLLAAGISVPETPGKTKKNAKNPLSDVTKASVPATGKDAPEASEGLRAALPPRKGNPLKKN